MEHTKTPWAFEESPLNLGCKNILGADGEEVCCTSGRDFESEDLANATFIVKCCNSHDKLVEALKIAREHFNETNTIRALSYSELVALKKINKALKEAGEPL